MRTVFKILLCTAVIFILCVAFISRRTGTPERIISYSCDPKKQDLRLFWCDENLKPFKSIVRLKEWVEAQDMRLLFAMNGGMYKEDHSPLGLFIQNGITKSKINVARGEGNFYLKPNGVFFIDADKKASVCKTDQFKNGKISYATQSGPMLVLNGELHPAFKKGSSNVNIRNGVGILPDGKILFAMSKEEINFYDFAEYFKKAGCKDAIYLDGFVSRTYLPEKNWTQTDGDFGVIIGVVDKK